MISDGVDGFLFPPGDAVAACETLAHALALSPEEYRSIGEAARNKALTFHRDREAEIVEGALLALEQSHGL